MVMMSKDEAIKLWQNEMGDKEYAYDFTGKKIKRSDYLVKNQVGWVITYLRPLKAGGNNNIGNIIIMHHRTFEEWNYQYPEFTIDRTDYIIHYDERGDFYYIEKVLDDDEDEAGFFI